MIVGLEAATRRATDAALLASVVLEGGDAEVLDGVILSVYGEDLSADVAADPALSAAVAGLEITPEIAEAMGEVSRLTAAALGPVLCELVLVHALALTRLAELQSCSRTSAAEDLIRLAGL